MIREIAGGAANAIRKAWSLSGSMSGAAEAACNRAAENAIVPWGCAGSALTAEALQLGAPYYAYIACIGMSGNSRLFFRNVNDTPGDGYTNFSLT